jgi:hypothetical protein
MLAPRVSEAKARRGFHRLLFSVVRRSRAAGSGGATYYYGSLRAELDLRARFIGLATG